MKRVPGYPTSWKAVEALTAHVAAAKAEGRREMAAEVLSKWSNGVFFDGVEFSRWLHNQAKRAR